MHMCASKFLLSQEGTRGIFLYKCTRFLLHQSAPVNNCAPVYDSAPVHVSAPVHNCAPVHNIAPEEHLCTSRGDSVHFRAERLKSSTSGKIAMFCRLLYFCLTYFPSHMIVMSPYMHNAWCHKLQNKKLTFYSPQQLYKL